MEENTVLDTEIFTVNAIDKDISPINQLTKIDIVGCKIRNGDLLGMETYRARSAEMCPIEHWLIFLLVEDWIR